MADQVRRDEKRIFEAVTPDLFRGRLFLKKKDPRFREGFKVLRSFDFMPCGIPLRMTRSFCHPGARSAIGSMRY